MHSYHSQYNSSSLANHPPVTTTTTTTKYQKSYNAHPVITNLGTGKSTSMWSSTDRAELREIPRSAEGPPQIKPTLRTLLSSFETRLSSTTASVVEAARVSPTPEHRVFEKQESLNFRFHLYEFGLSNTKFLPTASFL